MALVLPVEETVLEVSALMRDTDRLLAVVREEDHVLEAVVGLLDLPPFDEREVADLIWIVVGVVAARGVTGGGTNGDEAGVVREALLDADAILAEFGAVGLCRGGAEGEGLLLYAVCDGYSRCGELWGIPAWMASEVDQADWIARSVAALAIGLLAGGRLSSPVAR